MIQIFYEGKKVKEVTIAYKDGCRLYFDVDGMTDFWCSGKLIMRPLANRVKADVYQIEIYSKNQILNIEYLVKSNDGHREGEGIPLIQIARVEWK
jgi:hypothetical protein